MSVCHFFFFFNDTATTEIYTLSLHDALPISVKKFEWTNPHSWITLEVIGPQNQADEWLIELPPAGVLAREDRKSTRLNSSHPSISYAVFCLKKKKTQYYDIMYVNSKTKTTCL